MTQPLTTIQQSILVALLDNKQTTRRETRPKKDKKVRYNNPDTGESYFIDTWIDVQVDVPTPMLAGNASNLTLNVIAKKWMG